MWLAGICTAAGVAAEGEPPLRGFDELVARGLGFDLGAFAAFLGTLPDYPACEAWVRAHARHCDAEAIAAVNAAIGIARTDGVPTVLANDLSDWERLRATLLR